MTTVVTVVLLVVTQGLCYPLLQSQGSETEPDSSPKTASSRLLDVESFTDNHGMEKVEQTNESPIEVGLKDVTSSSPDTIEASPDTPDATKVSSDTLDTIEVSTDSPDTMEGSNECPKLESSLYHKLDYTCRDCADLHREVSVNAICR